MSKCPWAKYPKLFIIVLMFHLRELCAWMLTCTAEAWVVKRQEKCYLNAIDLLKFCNIITTHRFKIWSTTNNYKLCFKWLFLEFIISFFGGRLAGASPAPGPSKLAWLPTFIIPSAYCPIYLLDIAVVSGNARNKGVEVNEAGLPHTLSVWLTP